MTFWRHFVSKQDCDSVRWDRFEEGVVSYVRGALRGPKELSMKNINVLVFGLYRALSHPNDYYQEVDLKQMRIDEML